MNALGLKVISRIANNNKIWNFIGKEKTLDTIYNKAKELKTAKKGTYGKKIKFTYFSVVVEHKNAGKLKIVFIKTKDKLIPIVSTDLEINNEDIIETYKRRWDIEQGYKELRQHFGFGQEENRIYEALIARITLSFFTYNIVSYINRISNEPKTIGGLFKDLECELHTLAIAMQTFIIILDDIAKIEDVIHRNEDLVSIIAVLQDITQKIQYKQMGLALSTALLLSACGSTGKGNSSSRISHNGVLYNTVKSPYTNRIWLDRNLGAKRDCISSNDYSCYGDYYQWGRGADGHQKIERGADGHIISISGTTTKRAERYISKAGSDFILAGDWLHTEFGDTPARNTFWSRIDGSSVCPVGFRVPTIDELRAELLDNDSAEVTDANDVFNTFLKLPAAGERNYEDGTVSSVGTSGNYWTTSVGFISSTGGLSPSIVYFGLDIVQTFDTSGVGQGYSVRCIKEED